MDTKYSEITVITSFCRYQEPNKENLPGLSRKLDVL